VKPRSSAINSRMFMVFCRLSLFRNGKLNRSGFCVSTRRQTRFQEAFLGGKIHWSRETLFLLGGTPRGAGAHYTSVQINLGAGPQAFSMLAQGKVNSISEENRRKTVTLMRYCEKTCNDALGQPREQTERFCFRNTVLAYSLRDSLPQLPDYIWWAHMTLSDCDGAP